MDDDVKTLLAVLTLFYGSSNGIGLLKDRLTPVKEDTEKLESKIDDSRYITTAKADAKRLLCSWYPFVASYVVMVLLVPAFLLLVALRGPVTVLKLIGLANTSNQTSQTGSSIFYWILFGLSIVATAHYLSDYGKAWWVLFKYLRKKPAAEANDTDTDIEAGTPAEAETKV